MDPIAELQVKVVFFIQNYICKRAYRQIETERRKVKEGIGANEILDNIIIFLKLFWIIYESLKSSLSYI